ncbi:MAG TPA: TonB-dependent receptor [Acidobacteriaceae bacterium]|nr:TonB-dependent receptor [Acidobacteriaceae bacterium]
MFRNSQNTKAAVRLPRALACLAILIAFAVAMTGAAYAQLAGTGSIAGTVQDPTGAVVGSATVTATNVNTNVVTTRTTTKSGDYNISGLIPGTYTVSVTATGFQGYKQENVVVDALNTAAVNVKLSVGQASETVTVTSAPPVLDTTDATIGGVMDNQMYSNLPIQMGAGAKADQRRVTDFAYLMPGVEYLNSIDQTSQTGIVNGSGPGGNVQEVYVDGINLPEADGVGDPRFTWTAIGVDSIDQFQMQTNGISAAYSGQGVQNYSIKSGTNSYHGSLYEYNRNTIFDAWQFVNKAPTLNAQGVKVPGGIKQREVQNEFGIVLNGPIIKNKLFLFGNYGQYRYQKGATYSAMTIPTYAMLGYDVNGNPQGYADFTGYAVANTKTPNTCTPNTVGQGIASNGCVDIYDPSTQVPNCSTCTRTIFTALKNGVPTVDLIPASRFSAASQFYNKLLLPYEPLTNQGSYTSNLAYGTPIGLANWYSTGSIDYTQSSRNQMRFLIAFGRQAATGLNSSSGLNPPFNTSQIYNPVTTVDVVKDTFTINSHLVNQAAFGYGRYQSDSVTPNRQPKYSTSSAGILNMPAGQASDGFPAISWTGGFDNPGSWGGYAWNNKINNTFSASDNLQWTHGKQNFTFGGQFVDMQFNYYKVVSPSGPMGFQFAATQTGGFSNGSSINSSTGSAVASYLLGAVNSSSDSVNVPGLGSRWKDPSFWVQDDYKVNERLTLNMGIRWDIYPSIHEAHNIFTFLNPTGANSVTGNKGTLMFTGNGDPATFCNCSSPSPISWKNWAPRLGFAFAATPKTVLRGSFNVNIARGDWTDGSQSGSPATLGITPSASAPGGLSAAPAFYWDGTACGLGKANGTACGWTGSIVAPAPPAGGTSLAEYGTGNTTALGQASGTQTYFDPYRGGRTPQYINWNVGIQRQVTRDMSITVSYVGSQGHFLNGGLANPSRVNKLTSNYAALAGYNLNGSAVTPCGPSTCGFGSGNTDLLASKATAAAIAGVTGLGFASPNPFSNGQTYLATLGVTGYFTAFPQFASVSDTTNFNGNTNFHALEVSLRQRAAHGLDFMLNYTYSKSIDDMGSFRTNDNARLDRALSVADQPQNLTATAVYALPFGKGKAIGADNRLVSAIGGGWSFSTIFTYHSGLPTTMSASGCGGTVIGTCMPSVVPGVQQRVGHYGDGLVSDPSSANYYAKVPYLNPLAYSVNQAGTDPSKGGATAVGQNTLAACTATPSTCTGVVYYVGNGTALYVPGNAPRVMQIFSMGAYNVDLGLKRSFPVWEKVSLQFEADLLNATNHVVWGGVNGGVAGSSFGTLPTGGPVNQARDAQLAARLNW